MNSQEFIGLQQDSGAWKFFTQLSFGVALFFSVLGLWFVPLELSLKGYMVIAYFFTIGSTITLVKTMRDDHESRKLVKKLNEVRAEKMIKDYELAA